MMHISHGFAGDMQYYFPQVDTRALARYLNQRWKQRVIKRAVAFQSSMGNYSGIATRVDMWYMLCNAFKLKHSWLIWKAMLPDFFILF